MRVAALGRAAVGMLGSARRWDQYGLNNAAWVHAPSIGESLAADPVVGNLKKHSPTQDFIHTFTSPSVADWPHGWASDRSDFSPPPFGPWMRRLVRGVRPRALILSGADLWPGMIRAVARADIPIVIIAGHLRPGSSRFSPAGLSLHRSLLPLIQRIGAPTEQDRTRWINLGANPERIVLTGDPRDAVMLDGVSDPVPTGGQRLVVGGSLEPSDERPISDLLAATRTSAVRWILVPHDPTAAHVRRWERTCERSGISHRTWDGQSPLPEDGDAVIVTARGVLGSIYRSAEVAYVGGGFVAGGVHSMAEPAASGIPALAGPFAVESPHRRFVEAGGATVTDLALQLNTWLANTALRREAGERARGCLDPRGAIRTQELVEEVL